MTIFFIIYPCTIQFYSAEVKFSLMELRNCELRNLSLNCHQMSMKGVLACGFIMEVRAGPPKDPISPGAKGGSGDKLDPACRRLSVVSLSPYLMKRLPLSGGCLRVQVFASTAEVSEVIAVRTPAPAQGGTRYRMAAAGDRSMKAAIWPLEYCLYRSATHKARPRAVCKI